MPKTELAIMDKDLNYLRAFVDFLSTDYSYKFNVSHFTSLDYLKDYLSSADYSVDVLLMDADSYSDEVSKYNIRQVILMSDGFNSTSDKNLKTISKYQSGDKLVSDILNCCIDSEAIAACTNQSIKKTKAIAVYSPVGGAGKTTMSICLAKRCIELGYRVFYLNLESAASTDMFFNCSQTHSLSEILYFLKEKNKHIINKIDALKSVDAATGIHFFGCADRALDYEEIESEDYKELIKAISSIGIYDFVFVDLSSELNKRNISVLEESDYIILLTLQDKLSRTKTKRLYNEMHAIGSELYEGISSKTFKVVNKYKQLGDDNDGACLKIPEIRDLTYGIQENVLINSSGITAYLDNLIGSL